MRKRLKILADVVMFLMFLRLMSYRPGRGLFSHGVLGCALFALFLAHHILNLRWHRGLGKGRCTFARVVFAAANFMLLAAMAAMAGSSVLKSGEIFAFSPFRVTQTARSLHTLSTAWGFALMSFHVGLHASAAFGGLRAKMRGAFPACAYNLLFLLVLAAGVCCFAKSGLWKNMLLVPRGNPSFSPLIFYGEHMMIALAACQLAYLLLAAGGKMKRKKPSQKYEKYMFAPIGPALIFICPLVGAAPRDCEKPEASRMKQFRGWKPLEKRSLAQMSPECKGLRRPAPQAPKISAPRAEKSKRKGPQHPRLSFRACGARKFPGRRAGFNPDPSPSRRPGGAQTPAARARCPRGRGA
jgi:hypothetical protein